MQVDTSISYLNDKNISLYIDVETWIIVLM